MDLRDMTRETEKTRALASGEELEDAAEELYQQQLELRDRTDVVVEEILELPDAEQDFGQELENLRNASLAMKDAEGLLEDGTTGPVAIAAETEAIEHLLRTRRGGGGGGGGGNSPGGGMKKGQTNLSALALAGRSQDLAGQSKEREVNAAVGHAGGETSAELRESLDRYFEKLTATQR